MCVYCYFFIISTVLLWVSPNIYKYEARCRSRHCSCPRHLLAPVSVPDRPVGLRQTPWHSAVSSRVQLYHHEFSCITMFGVAPLPEGEGNPCTSNKMRAI